MNTVRRGKGTYRLGSLARRAVDKPAECRRNAVEILRKSLWKSHEQSVDSDVNIFIAAGNRDVREPPL
jgi:hypothetical protein